MEIKIDVEISDWIDILKVRSKSVKLRLRSTGKVYTFYQGDQFKVTLMAREERTQ